MADFGASLLPARACNRLPSRHIGAKPVGRECDERNDVNLALTTAKSATKGDGPGRFRDDGLSAGFGAIAAMSVTPSRDGPAGRQSCRAVCNKAVVRQVLRAILACCRRRSAPGR